MPIKKANLHKINLNKLIRIYINLYIQRPELLF